MWLIQIRVLRKKLQLTLRRKGVSEKEKDGWRGGRETVRGGRGSGWQPGELGAFREAVPQGKGASDTLTLWPPLLGLQSLGNVPCDSYVCLGQASSHSRVRGRVGSGETSWVWGLPHSAHWVPGGDGSGGPSQLPLFHT